MEYLEGKKIIESRRVILEDIKRYYPKNEEPSYSETKLYYNPFFGKFPFNGHNIYFFIIFHQVNFSGRYRKKYNRTNYINRNLPFIEKKILKEVLKINEKDPELN